MHLISYFERRSIKTPFVNETNLGAFCFDRYNTPLPAIPLNNLKLITLQKRYQDATVIFYVEYI